MEKWFFFPREIFFQNFFIFLPCIWKCWFDLFGLFWSLWPFIGLFLAFEVVLLFKHSLGVGNYRQIGRKSHPPWQNDPTLDIFISSDRSVSLGSLYPLGSQLQPSLRSCVKTTLGGKGCPRKHFSLRRKKNPRWHRFSMEERDISGCIPKPLLEDSMNDCWRTVH